VLSMMLLIEYLTIKSKGRLNKFLQKNPFLQIIFAALVGITPGCLGIYAVVSLYTHRVISFAALITAMIATVGDEAFVMFSVIPATAIKLTVIIFAVSILFGIIIRLFIKDKNFMNLPKVHVQFHENEPHCNCYEPVKFIDKVRYMIWQRIVLLAGGIIIVVLLLLGYIGHEHLTAFAEKKTTELVETNNQTHIEADNHHSHSEHENEWGIEKISFLLVTLIGIAIIVTVPNHFLSEHLWEHVIKKHLLKLFLWTLGAFTFLYVFNQLVDLETWIQHNLPFVLLIAVLIGLIPESGPHLIFIFLFANGMIPFSVLFANSIVQDGHGAIPLLAESRKNFLIAKGVTFLIGIIVGYGLYVFGF